MTKLNQIVAVVNGKKSKNQKTVTELNKLIQKRDLFNGLMRTYHPIDDEGETFPSETKRVQMTAKVAIDRFVESMADMMDCVLSQDESNCNATSDVIVDDKVVLSNVPVTHLLFLEKQLNDVHTYVSNMPVLDPADEWQLHDGENGVYRNTATNTVKTKKVLKNHVKAEATDKFPAQVDVYNEDVKVGEWSNQKFSGGLPEGTKNTILNRIVDLQEAVKTARENANSKEASLRRDYANVLSDLLRV